MLICHVSPLYILPGESRWESAWISIVELVLDITFPGNVIFIYQDLSYIASTVIDLVHPVGVIEETLSYETTRHGWSART